MHPISMLFRIARAAGRMRGRPPAALASAIESLCARRSAWQAARLGRQIAGRPVLVLGSGPMLNMLDPSVLDPALLREIERRYFIVGVNRTFYRCRLDIFLSAYPIEHCLARMHRGLCRHRIQIRPTSYIPVVAGSTAWRRVIFGSVPVPSSLGDGSPPIVRTKMNVALAATDLAVRLGARIVYYLGVEQNNQTHFFDQNEAVRRHMEADMRSLAGLDDAFVADHSYATLEPALSRLACPLEELEREPFYEVDHGETFSALFDELRASGANFYSIGENTVVARGGARVLAPEEWLRMH